MRWVAQQLADAAATMDWMNSCNDVALYEISDLNVQRCQLMRDISFKADSLDSFFPTTVFGCLVDLYI